MKYLYKQMVVTQGKIKMEVSLVRNNIVCVKTIACMRPKNRRQKKLWKQEAYKMKKVEKGLYEVTQCCNFSIEMFAKAIGQVIKDENGEPWFADPNEQSETNSKD